ncbi:hypothetical protein [Lachnoclostridium sp.]|uniref:hypothetical protein n=1 Tax=Lachnoclostridium sp. TaxID=2028282 RepID=UPI002899F2F1|nr:hypothetical protein [Lachnoclostridium sp.]
MCIIEKEFSVLKKICIESIEMDTLEEAKTGQKMKNSLNTIFREGRLPAVGARMTSKPLTINEYKVSDEKIIQTGKILTLTGMNIKDMFVESVMKYGYTFYPYSGDLPKEQGLKQLRLFVKIGEKYNCLAKFDIEEVIKTNELTVEQAKKMVDPSIVINWSFNYLIRICNVQIKDLPSSYLGSASGLDIYEKAFNGGCPNIVLI